MARIRIHGLTGNLNGVLRMACIDLSMARSSADFAGAYQYSLDFLSETFFYYLYY